MRVQSHAIYWQACYVYIRINVSLKDTMLSDQSNNSGAIDVNG